MNLQQRKKDLLKELTACNGFEEFIRIRNEISIVKIKINAQMQKYKKTYMSERKIEIVNTH